MGNYWYANYAQKEGTGNIINKEAGEHAFSLFL